MYHVRKKSRIQTCESNCSRVQIINVIKLVWLCVFSGICYGGQPGCQLGQWEWSKAGPRFHMFLVQGGPTRNPPRESGRNGFIRGTDSHVSGVCFCKVFRIISSYLISYHRVSREWNGSAGDEDPLLREGGKPVGPTSPDAVLSREHKKYSLAGILFSPPRSQRTFAPAT